MYEVLLIILCLCIYKYFYDLLQSLLPENVMFESNVFNDTYIFCIVSR